MNRVDFYLLPDTQQHARLLFACKLTEKAHSLNNTVYLQTENENQARILDDLLWNFKQDSFIPHGKTSDEYADQQTILIGDSVASKAFDLFVNLTNQMPDKIEQHQRVAEIIDQEPECKNAGRDRYKCYKEQNIELNYHKL